MHSLITAPSRVYSEELIYSPKWPEPDRTKDVSDYISQFSSERDLILIKHYPSTELMNQEQEAALCHFPPSHPFQIVHYQVNCYIVLL